MLRESLTWAGRAGAGEEDNVQSKKLIKVKDEWFQTDSEASICFMSFICFCSTVHSVTPCLSRYNGENLPLERWVRCCKT